MARGRRVHHHHHRAHHHRHRHRAHHHHHHAHHHAPLFHHHNRIHHTRHHHGGAHFTFGSNPGMRYRFKAAFRSSSRNIAGANGAAPQGGSGNDFTCPAHPCVTFFCGIFFLFPGIGLTASGALSPAKVTALAYIGGLLLAISVLLFVTTCVLFFMCEPAGDPQMVVTAGGVVTSQGVSNQNDVELGQATGVAAGGSYPQAYPEAAGAATGPYPVAQPYPQVAVGPTAPPADPYPQSYPQPSQPYPAAMGTVAPVYPDAPVNQDTTHYPDSATKTAPPPSYESAVAGGP